MAKKHKKYVIDSFEKLFNVVTNENVDNLSIDLFKWFLFSQKMVEEVKRQHPKETKGKLNSEIMKFAFLWVDDGKEGMIGVELHNTKTGEVTHKMFDKSKLD